MNLKNKGNFLLKIVLMTTNPYRVKNSQYNLL